MMQLIDFAKFANRRAAQAPARETSAAAEAPVFDRWAELHSVRSEQEKDAPAEFWDDLQFRLAYPTHPLRRH